MKQGLLARKALLDAAAAQDTDGASADFWLETIATLDPRNAKKTVGRLEMRFIQILSNDVAAPAIFSPCGLCNFCLYLPGMLNQRLGFLLREEAGFYPRT